MTGGARKAELIYKAERDTRQRRHWEEAVRDENHLRGCADYAHLNRLKHHYVDCISDWAHSSSHR